MPVELCRNNKISVTSNDLGGQDAKNPKSLWNSLMICVETA